MGAAVAHPISPELVLVCPELREHALTLLPAVDPDELFAVEPRQAAPVAERPVLALVEADEPAEPVEPVSRSSLSRPRTPNAAPHSPWRSSPT